MAWLITILWVLIGDFNQVLRQEDKRGGRMIHGSAVDRMQCMVNTCKLIELEFSGSRFTWSNGQEGRLLIERLDQTWANEAWMNRFDQATLHHLLRTDSDHSPLLLQTKGNIQHSGSGPPFQFQAC